MTGMSSIFKWFSYCKLVLPTDFRAGVWRIFKFAWPLVISDLTDFFIITVSLQFIGQYGKRDLAAVGLAISYCNVFGFTVVMGLDTSTTMLCAQSYGAKNYRRYGIVVQRALILQTATAVCVAGLWINSEQILILLQQDKEISRLAGIYILWRVPTLLLMAIYRTLKSYIYCQQIVLPLAFLGTSTLGVCVICNIILVNVFKFGMIGSSVSSNVTYLFACLLTVGYIRWKKIYKTWPGWSWECLLQWRQFFAFAVPGALMVLFDWATGECGVFFSGILGEVQLATQSVIGALLGLLFMFPLGIAAAAGVNAGKYLGAAEPDKAVNIVKSAFFLGWGLSLLFAMSLFLSKDVIGYAFTRSKPVVEMIAKVIPLISGFTILDCTQGICAGVCRGVGLQKYGAAANFVGLTLMGVSLGVVFSLVLRWDLLGYWGGLFIGMIVQVISLFMILSCHNWKTLSVKARKRALAASRIKTKSDENIAETELAMIDNHLNGRVSEVENSAESTELVKAGKHNDSGVGEKDSNAAKQVDVDGGLLMDNNEGNIELDYLNDHVPIESLTKANQIINIKISATSRALRIISVILIPVSFLAASILIKLYL